jgi:hypothetical protein
VLVTVEARNLAQCRFPARPKHGIDPLMRLSGLEPMEYTPNTENMRSTFLYIGERCNVAGSSIYKKVGAGVLLLMSASVLLAAVACRYPDMAHMPHARVNADCRPSWMGTTTRRTPLRSSRCKQLLLVPGAMLFYLGQPPQQACTNSRHAVVSLLPAPDSATCAQGCQSCNCCRWSRARTSWTSTWTTG